VLARGASVQREQPLAWNLPTLDAAPAAHAPVDRLQERHAQRRPVPRVDAPRAVETATLLALVPAGTGSVDRNPVRLTDGIVARGYDATAPPRAAI
jgi:hypothetical protein